ncbi:hypothetical protein WR25_04444 isoform B [Diploscapter pachys]|uniref:FXNA-like protease n=1 Tax=Diploscapter pachys TaxID=2018661 RepID=A0A2A2LG24_9BILA|nr:hypothetical protein WR25_04444 isoform B [Diploscapter pachys]
MSLKFNILSSESGLVNNSAANELQWGHWKIIIGIFTLLLFGSLYLHKCLPTPKEPNEDYNSFSEIRAQKILYELSNYGPKPAGSVACEQLTRNRIYEELKLIKSSASAFVNFDIDTQFASGCFHIPKFDVDGFTICYRNVSNVMVRIGQVEQSKNERKIAVLLNCHYDSWPTSSAGSDDLISCALMLEIARLLSKAPQKLHHDVILLFNGAEESSLQAAHGFITTHPWRHDVRAFINLEASGSGGRELLFQAGNFWRYYFKKSSILSGPANQWLLNAYLEAAVHPHCSVIGQEVFQSGVYPGDTDYRVFRDYGKIPGLDLAFVQNGYWWHTEFDEAVRITNGSLQRAGENVYSVLTHLLASPYLERPAEYGDKRSVFFDFLGLFVVVYDVKISHMINIVAIFIGFLVTMARFFQDRNLYIRAFVEYFAVLISMVAVTYGMTKMVAFLYGTLQWYTHHWIAAIIYGIPIVWTGYATQTFFTSKLASYQILKFSDCLESIHLAFIAAILMIFTYYDVAKTQKLLIFPLWLILPGAAMLVYTSEMLISIFIPIMGRTSSNPEPIVASFIALPTVLIMLSLLPFFAKTKTNREPNECGPKDFVYSIFGIFFVMFLIVSVLSAASPSPFRYKYEYPTAKRTQFFHVNRLMHNRDGSIIANDSRLYAISHDYRGAEDIPFVKSDPEWQEIEPIYTHSHFKDIPYYFPTRARIDNRHIRYRVSEEQIKFSKPTKITLNSKKQTSKSEIEYDLSVSGFGQMSVYMVADPQWIITEFTALPVETYKVAPIEKDTSLFLFLTCSSPENHCTWNFKIVMSLLPSQTPDQEKPLLIGASSHYIYGPEMQSKSLQQIESVIRDNRLHSNQWTITPSSWNADLVYRYF